MADRDPVDVVFRELDAEFPKFRFLYKDESRLMKAIDVFLKVVTLGMMSAFMTGFITTIGFSVYVPRKGWFEMNPVGRAVVMRHERVHMRQRVKYGMTLFSLLYVLLPLPGGLAYFRAKFEKEAYEETIRAAVFYGVDPTNETFRENIVRVFVGPQYVWMWPFRKSVEAWYDAAAKDVLSKRS